PPHPHSPKDRASGGRRYPRTGARACQVTPNRGIHGVMPKINVYLPDELAEAVKESGLPVSAVCQRALEVSVRRVGAIRAAVIGALAGEDPPAGLTQVAQRARSVLKLAVTNARERGAAEIGTRDLLVGMVTEGANLALHVLRSID